MRALMQGPTTAPRAPRPPSVLLARPAGALLLDATRKLTTSRQSRRLLARADAGEGSGSAGSGTGSASSSAADARAAVLARLEAAKRYKAGSSSSAADAPPAGSAAAPAAPPPAPEASVPSWMLAAGGGDFTGGGASSSSAAPTALPLPFDEQQPSDDPPPPAPRRPDFFTAEGDAAPALPDLLAAAPERADGGSADRPANFLAGVFGGGGGGNGGADGSSEPGSTVQFDGRNMRAEAFTAAREAMARRRGAEIITADPSYDPGFVPPPPEDAALASGDAAAALKELERQAAEQQGQQENADADATADGPGSSGYKPKVSTWGVFERPNNISAAYGGGRDIKPGQELESKEQREQREAAYAASLAAFRKKAGLEDVSPEIEAQARALLQRADALFRQGKLREALAPYEEARALMPLRTTLGGRATLGAGICLDSLGRGEAARSMYSRLRGHPDAATAKQAKRLDFGFQASSFLKAETISYARGNKEYAKYFRAFADANRVYAASEEERRRDDEAARRAALVALGVMAAPVAGVLALVVGGK